MADGPDSAAQLTVLLQAWSGGDSSALERLTPFVYDQLHRLASARMGAERTGHVLQPSALVNEAFVRLMHGAPMDWKNRAHFFAFSARLMRQILVDFARAQMSDKRGNRAPHLELEAAQDMPVAPMHSDILDVDNALKELAAMEPRQARVVELRYFGGLPMAEVAEVLGVSEDTVWRDWQIARAWLYYRLRLLTARTP
ncbi:MAG TPA: ECF-type sigma factor [Bryobacteraceae bacterium]|nr:ECF-type sigma factor [Bryobacteraceae bacterium]